MPLLRLTSVWKPPPADCKVHCWVLVPLCANCTSPVPLAVDDCGTSSTLPLCRLVSRETPAVVVMIHCWLAPPWLLQMMTVPLSAVDAPLTSSTAPVPWLTSRYVLLANGAATRLRPRSTLPSVVR